MNKSILGIFGTSLAGLFVLFAMHGAQFFSVAEAALLFLGKLAATTPYGLASFLLALAIALGVKGFTLRGLELLADPLWGERSAGPRSRHAQVFLAELLALIAAVGVMWLQARSLNALLLGLLAGLLVPLVYRGGAAVLGWAWKKVKTDAPV